MKKFSDKTKRTIYTVVLFLVSAGVFITLFFFLPKISGPTFLYLTSATAQVFAALVVFSFAVAGMIIERIKNEQRRFEDKLDYIYPRVFKRLTQNMEPSASAKLIDGDYNDLKRRLEDQFKQYSGYATNGTRYTNRLFRRIRQLKDECDYIIHNLAVQETRPVYTALARHLSSIINEQDDRYIAIRRELPGEMLDSLKKLKNSYSLTNKELSFIEECNNHHNSLQELLSYDRNMPLLDTKNYNIALYIIRNHGYNNGKLNKIPRHINRSLISSTITILASIGLLIFTDVLSGSCRIITASILAGLVVLSIGSYYPLAKELLKPTV